MAQTLEHNQVVTQVVPITVPSCDVDVTVIQQLDDEPNDVGGLTAAELKAKFDETNAAVKSYINDELIPAVVGADATEQARASAEAERVANEIERVSNETTRVNAETTRGNNETARQGAEITRGNNETARQSAETTRGNNETTRVSNETIRQNNEEARQNNEKARVLAEAARENAETGRASAETARDAAEQERVAAEQARADETSGIVARATEQANIASSAAASAGNSAAAAANSESAAASSAGSAADSAAAASTSETNAKSEADRAKSEADRVAGIVGDYATKTALAAHTDDTDIHVTAEEKTAWNAKADAPFKPAGKSYLTFSSSRSFTLAVNDATKHWNGTLEYFASNKTWTVWDGTTTLSAVDNDGEYVLYLRGTGNTMITGTDYKYKWTLTGSNIKCIGNIENLLDYATVESGGHPTMAGACYRSMFSGCTSLTQAPALPATTMANNCYAYMFNGCTALTEAPALPATTLADYCYYGMFQGCTALTQAPALPATTLVYNCYNSMFKGCTALTKAPALPATTLVNYCYAYMFQDCTGLTQSPALPATTMADYCYSNMFFGCTALTKAPALPATTLADHCYYGMFQGCTALTQAPALPATTLDIYCYAYMFKDCTGLKLSFTQTGEYSVAYRVPTTGTGTTAENALINMFSRTGGTFTGTPEINTTYYLSNDSDVFISTYGETTSVELEAAYQAGKLLVMRNGNLTAPLFKRFSENQFMFVAAGLSYQCFYEMWASGSLEFDPSKHASAHASGGTDPITPESIGASPASHAEDTAIHLPTVTADDNGKFLCVVNGAWAAVAYPSAEDSTF